MQIKSKILGFCFLSVFLVSDAYAATERECAGFLGQYRQKRNVIDGMNFITEESNIWSFCQGLGSATAKEYWKQPGEISACFFLTCSAAEPTRGCFPKSLVIQEVERLWRELEAGGCAMPSS